VAENRVQLKIRSHSPRETLDLGTIIGRNLEEGDIVALVGELGAGKTCFAQGIAIGIDVPEAYTVTSPTFTFINEYPGRVSLFHMDMYRLGDLGETMDMGLDEYFDGAGVTVIEWAERIQEILPERALIVSIVYVDEAVRDVTFSGTAEQMDYMATAFHEGGYDGWR
jgi:tRNA threonylcarbamoyladenosine biosynthesis protein TsaE